MKKIIFFLILLNTFCFITLLKAQAPQKRLSKIEIFNANKEIKIVYKSCGSNTAKQGIKIEKIGEKSILRWIWKNKSSIWCGWGTESLPVRNLKPYLEDYQLLVKFKGICDGKLPQVKFIDQKDQHSSILNFDDYISSGDLKTGVIIKIPIKDFDFDMNLDSTRIRTLQFDAEYNSNRGDLEIEYIEIVKI